MPADIYTKILKRLLEKGLLQLDELVERGVIEEPAIDRMMEEILIEERGQTSASQEVVTLNLESSSNAFGRYKDLKFVAEGGMAKVYKAYDPELKRNVALKFLRIEDASLKERLLREARAQAGIEHPNICKVYEVGEQNGRPYIAMQHLDGMTLKEAAQHLGLEQKVFLIKQVAESLQEAHRLGLIHRDIKPSNIMVETGQNAQPIPYLVDFGLARQVTEPGMTLTDFVVGTPSYMSPEQASGKVHSLDRRSDIYSLGVTFYELLCGELPYKQNGASMVQSVISEEAIRLRKRNPSISSDLETIVMKCLEKDPERRYESARALADDLQRYLNGEPILARPQRLSYRMMKKIRRNKVTSAILGAAIIVTLMLLGVLIWVQWRSELQTRYANEFGQEVRYIDSMMRSVYMAPLHDIRSELTRVNQMLIQLEERTNQAGKYAVGPGHNALGQGYLILRDYEKARHHLNAAWKSGYQESSTAFSLGKVMGLLYQQRLSDVERIQNKESREASKKEIQKTYRDPAIGYLKTAVSDLDTQAYVVGLIAFYEQRFEEAKKKSQEAYNHARWSYEAKKLEGDVYTSIGRQALEVGNHEKALQAFGTAEKAYDLASNMGRSDQGIYLADCDRWLNVMLLHHDKGTLSLLHLKAALDACDKAVQINPDQSESYRMKAFAYLTLGNFQFYHTDEDPRVALNQSIVFSQEAIKRNSRSAEAFKDMAAATSRTTEYEITNGLDPYGSTELALRHIHKALEINPNYADAHNIAGNIHGILGEYLTSHNVDPRPALKQSIIHFQKALQINPKHSGILNNLGISFLYVAAYEVNNGADPQSSFQSAIHHFKKALQINPKEVFADHNLGFAHYGLAWWEMEQGKNPASAIQKCIEQCQKVIRVDSTHTPAFRIMAECNAILADYKVKNNEDPESILAQAFDNAQKALQINPVSPMAYSTLAIGYRIKALNQIKNSFDPESSLNFARLNIRKTLDINRDYNSYWYIEGRVEIVAAQWELQNRRSPLHFLKKAREALTESLKLNSKDADSYIAMAVCNRLEAEWQQLTKKRASDAIGSGLEMSERALSIKAENPEALAIKGTLYLLQAQEEKDESRRMEFSRNAKSFLERALKKNSLLNQEYEPFLKKAVELVDSFS